MEFLASLSHRMVSYNFGIYAFSFFTSLLSIWSFLKGRLGSAVSLLAVGSEVVRLNQPLYIKQR